MLSPNQNLPFWLGLLLSDYRDSDKCKVVKVAKCGGKAETPMVYVAYLSIEVSGSNPGGSGWL